MSAKNEVIEKAEKHFSQPFFLNMLMSSQECPKIDDDIDLFHMTIPEIVNIVLDSGMDEKELQSRVNNEVWIAKENHPVKKEIIRIQYHMKKLGESHPIYDLYAENLHSLKESVMDHLSYHDLFREGLHHKGYQPDSSVFPEKMASYELFGNLENGLKAYPNIPKDKWMEFDFSEDEPIENPEFID